MYTYEGFSKIEPCTTKQFEKKATKRIEQGTCTRQRYKAKVQGRSVRDACNECVLNAVKQTRSNKNSIRTKLGPQIIILNSFQKHLCLIHKFL